MNIPQARDNTRSAVVDYRITDNLRPVAGASYAAGTVLALVPADQQIWTDFATVGPTLPGDLVGGPIMGLVPGEWIGGGTGGFDGRGLTTAPGANARGSSMVDIVTFGQQSVLIDNSGAAATALAHGTLLSSSQVTGGRAQGAAGRAVPRGSSIGTVVLPSVGLGSALSAGAITQASQTYTVTAYPVGSTLSATLQISGNPNTPGVPVTKTVTTAPSTLGTTASGATAIAAAINLDPVLSLLYTATVAGSVVTIASLGSGIVRVYPLLTYQAASINSVTGGFPITASGSGANGLTLAASGNGGGTATTGGAALAGGVGYYGIAPAFVMAAL